MIRAHVSILLGMCLATHVWAGDAPSSPASGTVPASGRSHPLAVNLATIGALSCVERGNQVAMFLDPAHTSQSLVQAPTDNPNHRLIMATMVLQPQPGNYTINNIALSPGDANGCGASYHTVAWVNLPCAKAEQTEFPNVKFTRINQFDVSTAVLSKNMWILAMSAGPGCVIEKEEIVE
jgi:hypothetical protein